MRAVFQRCVTLGGHVGHEVHALDHDVLLVELKGNVALIGGVELQRQRLPHGFTVGNGKFTCGIAVKHVSQLEGNDLEIDRLGRTVVALNVQHHGCVCLGGHLFVVGVVDRVVGTKRQLCAAFGDPNGGSCTGFTFVINVLLLSGDLYRHILGKDGVVCDLKGKRCGLSVKGHACCVRARHGTALGATVGNGMRHRTGGERAGVACRMRNTLSEYSVFGGFERQTTLLVLTAVCAEIDDLMTLCCVCLLVSFGRIERRVAVVGIACVCAVGIAVVHNGTAQYGQRLRLGTVVVILTPSCPQCCCNRAVRHGTHSLARNVGQCVIRGGGGLTAVGVGHVKAVLDLTAARGGQCTDIVVRAGDQRNGEFAFVRGNAQACVDKAAFDQVVVFARSTHNATHVRQRVSAKDAALHVAVAHGAFVHHAHHAADVGVVSLEVEVGHCQVFHGSVLQVAEKAHVLRLFDRVVIKAADCVPLTVKVTRVAVFSVAANGRPCADPLGNPGQSLRIDCDIRGQDGVCVAVSCIFIRHLTCKPVKLACIADLVVARGLVVECGLKVRCVCRAKAVFINTAAAVTVAAWRICRHRNGGKEAEQRDHCRCCNQSCRDFGFEM